MGDRQSNRLMGVYSLNTPTAITAAAKIFDFEDGSDVHVIARGSNLQFARFQNDSLIVKYEYHLFGSVVQIIPLRHHRDNQSNILIIYKNNKYCVLRYKASIVCVQSGCFQDNVGISLDPPYKFAIGQNSLILQVREQVLLYFGITTQSTLYPPFNWSFSCESIKDFRFIGIADEYKVIILIKEYDNPIRLQIYDINCVQTQTFLVKSHVIQADIPDDAYRIQNISENTIILFTTKAACRLTFHSSYHPTQQSYTIYTSHPITFIERLSGSYYLATDTGNNLLYLFLPDTGNVKVTRISAINNPIALIGINSTSALSISEFGETNVIYAIYDEDYVRVNSVPLVVNPGPIESILELSTNDIIGLCKNKVVHFIRKALSVKQEAVVEIPNLNNVWFAGSDTDFVVTFGNQSAFLRLEEGKTLLNLEKENFAYDQPTIAFTTINEDGFVQITPKCIRIQSSITLKTAEFDNITTADIINDQICLLTRNENFDSVILCDLYGNVISQIDLLGHRDVIALSEELFAVASWKDQKIEIYSINTQNIVNSYEGYPILAIMFTENYFIALEPRDKIHFYSLIDFSEYKVFYCSGYHSSLILCGYNDVMIGGEIPYYIKDEIIHGINNIEFTVGDYNFPYCVCIKGDELQLCTISSFEMSVHQERLTLDIVDIAKIPQSELYIIAYKNSSDFLKIGTADHPKAQISTLQIYHESYQINQYVAMTSILTHGKYFIALALKTSVILFELNGKTLEHRSNTELKYQPFGVMAYEDKLIIGFQSEFILYDFNFISLSNIQLSRITITPTQGASCCMAYRTHNSLVAVGDELESLMIYRFIEDKFVEIAKSSYSYGISQCLFIDDFCIITDQTGILYQIEKCNAKNGNGELKFIGCYNIGHTVSTMISLEKSNKIIIGSYDGQYTEVISYEPNEQFNRLYQKISKVIGSLGDLTSNDFHAASIHGYYSRYALFNNFDLLTKFLLLDQRIQSGLATEIGMTLEEAQSLCEQMLELT